MSSHSERVEQKIGPWVCDHCGRSFTSDEESIGHLDLRAPAHDGYRFCPGFVSHEDATDD